MYVQRYVDNAHPVLNLIKKFFLLCTLNFPHREASDFPVTDAIIFFASNRGALTGERNHGIFFIILDISVSRSCDCMTVKTYTS